MERHFSQFPAATEIHKPVAVDTLADWAPCRAGGAGCPRCSPSTAFFLRSASWCVVLACRLQPGI
eukprot:242226-Rhodomonas_salina.3